MTIIITISVSSVRLSPMFQCSSHDSSDVIKESQFRVSVEESF